jgi:hypothetical protein
MDGEVRLENIDVERMSCGSFLSSRNLVTRTEDLFVSTCN